MSNNFWNWAPSPLELKLKDARANANMANMQGYIPYENDPRNYEETPAVHAQEMMSGYVPAYAGYSLPNSPAQVPSNEIQGGVRIPQSERGALGTGMAYTQQQEQIAALKDEYARNEQRIAQIEQELRTISYEDRKAIDELDLALAENRAGIGDLGSSQMHMNRIDNRRAADRNHASSGSLDRVAAEDEIDRLYVQRAEATPSQQAYIDRAIKRKEDAYEKTYGKKYGGLLDIPTGAQDKNKVTTFQGYDDVLQQELVANGKNGRLSTAQIEKLSGILDTLPAGAERNERKKALDAVKSNEKHASDVSAQKKKETDAIEEVAKSVSGWDLTNTGDSKSVPASNGKTVTVTRMAGGGIQYKCGSSKR